MVDEIVEQATYFVILEEVNPDQAIKVIKIEDESGDEVEQVFPQRMQTINTTLFHYLPMLPLFKAQMENDSSWVGWTFKHYPNVQILEWCHPPQIHFGRKLFAAHSMEEISSTSFPPNFL